MHKDLSAQAVVTRDMHLVEGSVDRRPSTITATAAVQGPRVSTAGSHAEGHCDPGRRDKAIVDGRECHLLHLSNDVRNCLFPDLRGRSPASARRSPVVLVGKRGDAIDRFQFDVHHRVEDTSGITDVIGKLECRRKDGSYSADASSLRAIRMHTSDALMNPRMLEVLEQVHNHALSAIAELVHNAESHGRASRLDLSICNASLGGDRQQMLVVADDGQGMDLRQLQHMLTFGKGKENGSRVSSMYGIGFKTGALRLGHEVCVLTVPANSSRVRLGLLSKRLNKGRDVLKVPIVELERDGGTPCSSASELGQLPDQHFLKRFVNAAKNQAVKHGLMTHGDKTLEPQVSGTVICITDMRRSHYTGARRDAGSSVEETTDIYELQQVGESPEYDLVLAHAGPLCSTFLPHRPNVKVRPHELPMNVSLRALLKHMFYKCPGMNVTIMGKTVRLESLTDELRKRRNATEVKLEKQTSDERDTDMVVVAQSSANEFNGVCGVHVYWHNILVEPFAGVPPSWTAATLDEWNGVIGTVQVELEPTNTKTAFVPSGHYRDLEVELRRILAKTAGRTEAPTDQVAMSNKDTWHQCDLCNAWRRVAERHEHLFREAHPQVSQAEAPFTCDMLRSVRKAKEGGFVCTQWSELDAYDPGQVDEAGFKETLLKTLVGRPGRLDVHQALPPLVRAAVVNEEDLRVTDAPGDLPQEYVVERTLRGDRHRASHCMMCLEYIPEAQLKDPFGFGATLMQAHYPGLRRSLGVARTKQGICALFENVGRRGALPLTEKDCLNKLAKLDNAQRHMLLQGILETALAVLTHWGLVVSLAPERVLLDIAEEHHEPLFFLTPILRRLSRAEGEQELRCNVDDLVHQFISPTDKVQWAVRSGTLHEVADAVAGGACEATRDSLRRFRQLHTTTLAWHVSRERGVQFLKVHGLKPQGNDDSKVTVAQHVFNNMAGSPFISMTTSASFALYYAMKWRSKENRNLFIVLVDLARVSQLEERLIDLADSRVRDDHLNKKSQGSNWALSAQEVLYRGTVPPRAIRGLFRIQSKSKLAAAGGHSFSQWLTIMERQPETFQPHKLLDTCAYSSDLASPEEAKAAVAEYYERSVFRPRLLESQAQDSMPVTAKRRRIASVDDEDVSSGDGGT